VRWPVFSSSSRREPRAQRASQPGGHLPGAAVDRIRVSLGILAARVYLSRFELLLEDHTIFERDLHGRARHADGLLIVCAALIFGAAIAAVNAVRMPRGLWLAAAILPAAVCYIALQESAGTSAALSSNRMNWCASSRISRTISSSLEAYGFSRITQREFPARQRWKRRTRRTIRRRCRTSGCGTGALQDTLRQIQEIRTYYDFPDIDIDRYDIDGATREVMLARAS